jgi:hypothetical protein
MGDDCEVCFLTGIEAGVHKGCEHKKTPEPSGFPEFLMINRLSHTHLPHWPLFAPVQTPSSAMPRTQLPHPCHEPITGPGVIAMAAKPGIGYNSGMEAPFVSGAGGSSIVATKPCDDA